MNRLALLLLLPVLALADTAPAAKPAEKPAPVQPAPAAATLTVKVAGIRNDKGELRVALHDNDTSFPKQWDKALKVVAVKIPAGKTEVAVKFDDLKPGTYAVMAHHDEDADGKIKRYIIGMPAEGMANSGTKPTFGAPAWKKSKFTVPETAETTLTLSYL